jgi:hypothetical protein
MFIKKILASVILISAMVGCATTAPELTPLEIQSMQTRSFEEDKSIVFGSVVSVFQDLGYQIESADLATGLITSESPADSVSNWATAFTGMRQVTQTRATAFVEKVGNQVNVRLNFLVMNQLSGGYGQSDRQDQPITDVEIYQNAFERIENAIFVRSDD